MIIKLGDVFLFDVVAMDRKEMAKTIREYYPALHPPFRAAIPINDDYNLYRKLHEGWCVMWPSNTADSFPWFMVNRILEYIKKQKKGDGFHEIKLEPLKETYE